MMRKTLRWLLYVLAAILALVIIVLSGFRIAAVARESQTRTDAAPPAGHFVHAADVDMYIQEWGPADGPAVVFLHAAGGWSEVWKQTGEDLAAEGFHAIALDMPPLGYSERPDTPRYSREDQAKRVIGVLDALHIKKATLVGHSFGGRAVAQTALMMPERVRAVVLVDAALSFNSAAQKRGVAGSFLDMVMYAAPVRNALVSATFTNPLFTRTLIKLFVADPKSASDYWVHIYQEPIDVQSTTPAIGDWVIQLLAERDSSLSSDPEAYKKLTMPALVIWGDKDTTTPLSLGEYIASIIPNSKIVVMEGLGHLPPLEDTQAFDDTLLKFLKANR